MYILNFFVIKFVWELRKWLEKCEKLVGKNQRTNWPKLQAQKLEPIETETNGFFNYFGRFQLRLLQIENFSFGWPDKKKKNRLNRTNYNLRLKEVGAIKEVFFPEWLANTVVVKKKNGKWRVCVNFADLNRACPKDPFTMPKIDQLVDATYGHPRINFLDAFQGYYQIALAVED